MFHYADLDSRGVIRGSKRDLSTYRDLETALKAKDLQQCIGTGLARAYVAMKVPLVDSSTFDDVIKYSDHYHIVYIGVCSHMHHLSMHMISITYRLTSVFRAFPSLCPAHSWTLAGTTPTNAESIANHRRISQRLQNLSFHAIKMQGRLDFTGSIAVSSYRWPGL
jgi:hypothetical protein